MPVQHLRCSGQAQHATSPVKNQVASKSPVGDISVVALIRKDITFDHRQNAVKVCKSLTITNNVDLEVKDMLSLLRSARMDYLLR